MHEINLELSASQLKAADQCFISWAFTYLYGLRSPSKPYQVFGKLIHACLESYAITGNVYKPDIDGELSNDLSALTDVNRSRFLKEAPPRALNATRLLPDLSQCRRWPEEVFTFNSSQYFTGPDLSWSPRSKIDLIVNSGSRWLVTDYKSTRGKRVSKSDARELGIEPGFHPWFYVPTAAELRNDVQFILYALAVMQAADVTEIEGRWIYILTDEKHSPRSESVDVTVTLDEMIEAGKRWIELGHCITQWKLASKQHGPPSLDHLKRNLPVVVYPEPKSPCMQYGGCMHHVTKKGKCDAGMDAASLLGG